MFSIIDRYLMITTLKYIALVLVFIIGMEFFVLLVAELSDIGQGSYHFWAAILYVILILPTNLYTLFPMAALLGSLIGLGLLGSHSELIILRSNGLSLWQISKPVLLTALIMSLLVSSFCEIFGTSMQQLANKYKVALISKGQAAATRHGLWFRYNENFINIAHIIPNKELKGITQFKFNDQQQLIQSFYASSAQKIHNQWELQQVRVSNFSNKQVKTSVLPTMTWPVVIDTHLLSISTESTGELNIFDLYRLIELRKKSGLNTSSIAMTFWQRTLQPVATLIMILLSLSFVFGSMRQMTMGLRMLLGIVFGFTFYLMNQFVAPLVLVYQIPAFIGAFLPIILFALLAYYLIQRVR